MAKSEKIAFLDHDLETYEELFSVHCPGQKFPEYRRIDDVEAGSLRQKLFKNIANDANFNGIEASYFVIINSKFIKEFICEDVVVKDVVFDLIKYIPDSVIINYRHFNVLYEMRFDDFCLYFDDLFYPGPDDMDIFDQNCNWLILFHHEEWIFYLQRRTVLSVVEFEKFRSNPENDKTVIYTDSDGKKMIKPKPVGFDDFWNDRK